MESLLQAIVDDDRPRVDQILTADPALATSRIKEDIQYDDRIVHWLYIGDTALHLAAAGYCIEIVQLLLATGANPNAAMNRRKSTPLHYAADGYIHAPSWDEKRQSKAIQCLLEAGAAINAQDSNGATPLHRAVRTRCAAAVKCLLDAGSDATIGNKSGSTPFHLAVQNTGRGTTGEDDVQAAQQQIIETFLSFGVKTSLKDGKGRSVVDCAKSDWIRQMLLKHVAR